MDHRQNESNQKQTDSSELPNSNRTYLSSVGEDSAAIGENKPVKISEREADPEWRQFVRQELENMSKPDETGQASNQAGSGTSSPPSLDQAAALLIEKIPFERLLGSTARFLAKKFSPKKKKKAKKRHKK